MIRFAFIVLYSVIHSHVEAVSEPYPRCMPWREVATDMTSANDAPVLFGYQVGFSTTTFSDCMAYLPYYDLLDIRYEKDEGFSCYVISLNTTGSYNLLSYYGVATRYLNLNWNTNPDFTLLSYLAGISDWQYSTGILGSRAVAFNGRNDWITLGSRTSECFGNLDLCSQGVTYSMWIKITNTASKSSSALLYYFTSGGNSKSSIGVALFSTGTTACWAFKTSRYWWLADDQFSVSYGRWQHVIATWSQSTGVQVYVNGLLVASFNKPKYLKVDSPENTDIRFGLSRDNSTYAEFTLEDFVVYYRVVSFSEAKQLFLTRYSRDYNYFWWDNPDYTLSRDFNLPRRTRGMLTSHAISFNGKDDSISLGNLRDYCVGNLDKCDKGVTYSLWLKITNDLNKPDKQTLYYFSSGAHTRWSVGVSLSSVRGKLSWAFKTSKQWWRKDGQFPVVYGEWQFLTATWSQSNGVFVYKNRQQVARIQSATNMGHNNRHNAFTIGRPNDKGNGQWNGEFTLDAFRVYYAAINQLFVQQLNYFSQPNQ